MAANNETNLEQTGDHPMIRGSPPPNTPRAPAALRGRGRDSGRSYHLSRGHGRGRDRSATGSLNQAQPSSLEKGVVFTDSQTEFPIIGESGSRRNSQTHLTSAASIVGVASEVSNPESRTSTPTVCIPQGPAWNPPKGPRKYMMYQNRPRTQRTRASSDSSSMHRASGRLSSPAESQVADKVKKQKLETYSAVVAGLNKGLKAKVEAPHGSGLVQRERVREASEKKDDKALRSSDAGSSKKSFVASEEAETAYEQVSIPLAYRDANQTASPVKRRARTVELPANELVKFSASVHRPGCIRTTDEFMVLEFGSAGPITLHKIGTP